MRKLTKLFLLFAGIVLSLVGCQEGPTHEKDSQLGHAVQFSATSGSPFTRTSYSGVIDANNWERIDWVDGDQILVWSDKAVSKADANRHYAKYQLTGVKAVDPHESHASLTDPMGEGLRYESDDPSVKHQFWAVYPAADVTPENGKYSYSIPQKQAPAESETTDGNIVQKPDMNKAVMLAALKDAVSKEKAELRFHPAYTAFEIELKNNREDGTTFSLKDVTLTSATKNGETEVVNTLAGNVAATILPDNATTYSIAEGADESVTYTFAGGSSVDIAQGKSLKFTVFALPQAIKGLSLTFTYGSGVQRRVTLKKNGADIDFEACYKHRILGLAMNEGWNFAELHLDGTLDWFDVEVNTDNKNYPESTQFEVEGANNGRYYTTASQTTPVEGRNAKAFRQYWLMKNDGSVTVRYKIMSPIGYKWTVVPCGDTQYYTVKSQVITTTETGTTTTLSDNLEGTIGDGTRTTNVILVITPKDPGTAPHQLYFKTYVESQDGTVKYNLDSETQLLEMRGYHYFCLNTTLD